MTNDGLIDVYAHLDAWLDASTDEERTAAEASLAATAEGRWWLALNPSFAGPLPAASPALADAVRRRLPPMATPVLTRFADLVLRAWEDPDFRAALRGNPRQTLAAHDVWLPEDVEPEIVPPTAAALPERHRLPIPLPEPGSPAVSNPEARRQLAETPFAWLWGPPWSAPATATTARTATSPATRFRRSSSWAAWLRSQRLAPSAAFGASLAALAVAIYLWSLAVPVADLSGSAVVGPADGGVAGLEGTPAAEMGTAMIFLTVAAILFILGVVLARRR